MIMANDDGENVRDDSPIRDGAGMDLHQRQVRISRPDRRPLIASALVAFGAAGALFVSGATADDLSPLQSLERYFERVETMQGRFTQEVRDDDGTLLEFSEGAFWVARPDRFRWVYDMPFPQQIVADGDALWVYDEDLQQVTMHPLDDAIGSGPALFLSGDMAALRARFTISEDAGWLRLEPLDDDWQVEFARMRFSGLIPERLDVLDGLGQGTRLVLSDVELNPQIDPDIFEFVLPDAVDLIDGTGDGW